MRSINMRIAHLECGGAKKPKSLSSSIQRTRYGIVLVFGNIASSTASADGSTCDAEPLGTPTRQRLSAYTASKSLRSNQQSRRMGNSGAGTAREPSLLAFASFALKKD